MFSTAAIRFTSNFAGVALLCALLLASVTTALVAHTGNSMTTAAPPAPVSAARVGT